VTERFAPTNVMTELQDSVERILAAGTEAENFYCGHRDIGGGVTVAVLVVEGHDGVFVGYGQGVAESKVDAFRNFRDRGGRGFPVLPGGKS